MFISFAAFNLFICFIGIMVFTADHLRTNLGLPSDKVGFLISITGFSGIAASPVAGFLGDRFGKKNVFLGGTAIAFISLAIMSIIKYSYPAYLTLFLILGIGTATAWTSLNTMGVQLSSALRKPVTSVYNAIKFSGYAFAPVVLALLYGPFHLRAVQFGCMGALIISSTLAVIGDARSKGRDL